MGVVPRRDHDSGKFAKYAKNLMLNLRIGYVLARHRATRRAAAGTHHGYPAKNRRREQLGLSSCRGIGGVRHRRVSLRFAPMSGVGRGEEIERGPLNACSRAPPGARGHRE